MIPRISRVPRCAAAALVLVLAGCAVPPVQETQVLVMKPGAPSGEALPPAGTVWRLEEKELLALSPAPYVAPAPQPIPMPPRVSPAVPVVPYAVPYYGWGAPFYGPSFGFSFGYSHPRYPHRRWRRY